VDGERRKGGNIMNTNAETAVLTVLERQAPQTFEELMALSGLSASQVLLVVDRLSREGTVVLRKFGPDYSVALGGM
jgi:DNA-binding Lrp family transcriptional regulator